MKRLAIILAVLAAPMAFGAGAAQAEPGAWIVKELGAKPGGGAYFVAQVASEKPLINVSEARQKATLSIRCDRAGLFVTFLWPDYVSGDTYDGSRADVAWKTDVHREVLAKWRKADQGVVALGKEGFGLLKGLAKGQTLTVRVPDLHGGQEAVFPIQGIDGLYDRVRSQGCG